MVQVGGGVGERLGCPTEQAGRGGRGGGWRAMRVFGWVRRGSLHGSEREAVESGHALDTCPGRLLVSGGTARLCVRPLPKVRTASLRYLPVRQCVAHSYSGLKEVTLVPLEAWATPVSPLGGAPGRCHRHCSQPVSRPPLPRPHPPHQTHSPLHQQPRCPPLTALAACGRPAARSAAPETCWERNIRALQVAVTTLATSATQCRCAAGRDLQCCSVHIKVSRRHWNKLPAAQHVSRRLRWSPLPTLRHVNGRGLVLQHAVDACAAVRRGFQES